MNKLNKHDLVETVAEKAHLSVKDAKAAIDASLELVEKALLNGQEVNFTNFGTFVPKTRPTRDGTNPKTHKRMTLKSKKTILFKVSKGFKDELNK